MIGGGANYGNGPIGPFSHPHSRSEVDFLQSFERRTGPESAAGTPVERTVLVRFTFESREQSTEDQQGGEEIAPGESVELTAVQAASDDKAFVLRVSPLSGGPLLVAPIDFQDAGDFRVTFELSVCSALGRSEQCDLEVAGTVATLVCP